MLFLCLATVVPLALSDWSEPTPEFTFARLAVTNHSRWIQHWPDYFPDQPPWKHDYPSSDSFGIGLIHELTGIRVSPDSYKIVELRSDEVFEYPFLYLSEPGFLQLTDKEIANLGEYIRRGGFIMADDFRNGAYLGGPEELDILRQYLKRALPERELVRLDIKHPIFRSFFEIDQLRMTPPYAEAFVPEFWGMSDENGRLQIIANYNNDVGDFWKYLDHGDKPLRDSTTSIRLGINYFIYAMSH